jgi:hypothetical protein
MLKPMHNGAFMVNDAAAADPVCQAAMEAYLRDLELEAARRREARQAWFSKWEESRPRGVYGTWNISDRD